MKSIDRHRVPLLEGCRSIENFEYLNKIDEGAYGVVYRA
jgi:cell division cycle 2-like protein